MGALTGPGLYVHIPFCARRCPYCAFVSLAGAEGLHEPYARAVLQEAARVRSRWPLAPLGTVYVGGGTPSLLEPQALVRMVDHCVALWGVSTGAEITVEANPASADRARFVQLRRGGFNRLSLGAQSLSDPVLQRLGRQHRATDVLRAYDQARAAGFENVSLDLIFGVPGLSLDDWSGTLREVVRLAPEHVSTYSLTVEEGTELAQRELAGHAVRAGEDEDAAAYEVACQILTTAGYEHYEVSNFARPGRRCAHSWGCWSGVEYVGLGASAHSWVGGRRHWNVADAGEYIRRIERDQCPIAGAEEIGPDIALRERVWLGLRTCAGVTLLPHELRALRGHRRFHDLLATGYLLLDGRRVRVSTTGWGLADALGLEISVLLESEPASEVASLSPEPCTAATSGRLR